MCTLGIGRLGCGRCCSTSTLVSLAGVEQVTFCKQIPFPMHVHTERMKIIFDIRFMTVDELICHKDSGYLFVCIKIFPIRR